MTTKEKEKQEEMTLSQFAPSTSRTMDVLVAINVIIATQQGLEDAYVVAQQAINYPPVVGLGEMPQLRRLQSPLLNWTRMQHFSLRLGIRRVHSSRLSDFSQHCCRSISSFTRVFGACSYPRFRRNTLPSPLDLVVRRRH